MAGQARQSQRDLAFETALEAAPERFGFFEALRWLERAYADWPRLGTAKRSKDDPIRLGQRPFVQFPAGELEAFEPAGADPARLWVQFTGLFGPNGPLPLHLTVHALERLERSHDASLIRFLNIFQHRMLSFMYRAWAEAEPTVQHDRPADDRFALYLGALSGLGLPSQRDRDPVPDVFKWRHAGNLGLYAHPPAAIEAMIGDFFGVTISIAEFVGDWLEIPPALRCQLGRLDDSMRLGSGAVLGERSFQCQHRFRLVIGPLGLVQYRRFLPGGEALAQLCGLVRLIVGDELEWDLQLVLARHQVPHACLARHRATAPELRSGTQLGWTSWLDAGGRSADADDLVLGHGALDVRVPEERLN